jgi:glutathione S-transferase
MITLYHAPMACSLASRLALVAAGLPHQIHLVDTGGGETRKPDYLAINPAGKVPALSVGGQIVTESAVFSRPELGAILAQDFA